MNLKTLKGVNGLKQVLNLLSISSSFEGGVDSIAPGNHARCSTKLGAGREGFEDAGPSDGGSLDGGILDGGLLDLVNGCEDVGLLELVVADGREDTGLLVTDGSLGREDTGTLDLRDRVTGRLDLVGLATMESMGGLAFLFGDALSLDPAALFRVVLGEGLVLMVVLL